MAIERMGGAFWVAVANLDNNLALYLERWPFCSSFIIAQQDGLGKHGIPEG